MKIFEDPPKKSKLLITDNNEVNLFALRIFLEGEGFSVFTAVNSNHVFEILFQKKIDLIILDMIMPELHSFETCRQIKINDKTKYIPVIITTNSYDNQDYIKSMENSADDFIVKPLNKSVFLARVKSLLRAKLMDEEYENYTFLLESNVRERTKSLILTQEATIFALAKLSESRDDETGAHLERTRLYCKVIAEELRKNKKYNNIINEEYIRTIYLTSPLHDIGKVGISDQILLKKDTLSEEEFEIIKTHTIIGGDTLKAAEGKLKQKSPLSMAKDIAYYHHEKFNGTGYPFGKKGDEIPLSARILAVADVYDALRSRRKYKKAWNHKEAIDTMIADSNTHFDSELITAFKIREKEFAEINDKFQQDLSDNPIQPIF